MFDVSKRIELIQLRSLQDHLRKIERIMEQTPSSYTPVKRLLIDLRRDRDSVKHRLRIIKKAYRLALKEEKIVSSYNLVMSRTCGSSSKQYREVDLRCRNAINRGNYRDAQRHIAELSDVIRSKDYRNYDLDIFCSRAEGGSIIISINNNVESSVIVKSISVTSPSGSMKVIDSSGFSIPTGGQKSVRVRALQNNPLRVDVCVDYDISDRAGRFYTTVEVARPL